MKFIKSSFAKNLSNENSLLKEYRQTGNLDVLGKLYEPYMHLVYGLCLKYFREEELSKDAVMQIFEQLIEKLKKHEVLNFKSWLYTLARNYCLMALRVSGRYDFVQVEENFMEIESFMHPDIEDIYERKLNTMEECLEKLPTEQKDAIRLFYLEKKCYREVAELTGYDLNKVKSYIQNGKRNLKICIENSGDE